jgi:hypothetical protein
MTAISWISIDGSTFNVPVLSMRRKAEFLYKYAERTVDGVLHSELIGVYFNYEITFGRTLTVSDYADLWDALTDPTEEHTVILPDEDGQHTFDAYFSNVKDEFVRVETDGVTRYMKGLTVNMIAIEPARSPS